MKFKKILLPIGVIAAVYLLIFLYNVIPYYKYDKITFNHENPEIQLQDILNNKDIEVKYIKSFMYDGKFLGFNAIINNDIFMNVTYLGESQYEKITLKKSNTNFRDDGFWLYSSPDKFDLVAKAMNSKNYPFKIDKEINYYLYDGKTGKKNIKADEIVLGDKFSELIFSTGGASISIDKKNINFAYNAGRVGKTSLSFIVYNQGLYVVNIYPLGTSEFKTLHSFYKK